MTAFSYGTAYFSAVLFIGFAGKIGWSFGYSSLWIALFNALVGVLCVWGIFGWLIKKASVKYNVATLSEFLEKRYGSKTFKLLSSIVIFIFLIPYSAAVFMGLSYLFTSNFGVEYWHALVFMGLFTSIYLVLGGYKSMAMIDLIFGIIMTVGVIILFISTLDKGGGISNITLSLQEIDPGLTKSVGPPGWWPLLSLIVLTSIAPFAMPQLVQKFYAIRDRRSIRIGMFASTFFALLIGGVAYFIGSSTRIFLNPESSPGAFSDGQPIYDRLMPELLANVIPESLSVIILLLILSASMSTLAALVLISSSSLAKDFYHGFINTEASDSRLTLLMRLGSAFFVLLSVILAYINPDTIVAILGISWGAIGSFFLGPFLWGLIWKGANLNGGMGSALIGLATCIGLYIYGFTSPQAGTIGMAVSFLANPVLSLLKKQPKEDMI
jgi:SSS family solute:Na+ symporter/sodium/proline symporter